MIETNSTMATPQAADDPANGAMFHGLAIVVADRGNVWVGRVQETYDGWLRIEDARVIRRWGTTEGLNQLATGGPRPATKLDAPATLRVATRAVIAVIPCEPAKWAA